MNEWPLIDDEDPHMRLLGAVSLATGTYWFIAPLLILSELLGGALDDIFRGYCVTPETTTEEIA